MVGVHPSRAEIARKFPEGEYVWVKARVIGVVEPARASWEPAPEIPGEAIVQVVLQHPHAWGSAIQEVVASSVRTFEREA